MEQRVASISVSAAKWRMTGAKGVTYRGTVGKIVASKMRRNTASFAAKAKRKPLNVYEQEECPEEKSTKLSL